MSQFGDFLLKLLAQFAGGPGPPENNLVRFGLPSIFWAVLLVAAWSRQRHQDLPRERLLVWGFGLGLVRELFMFVHLSIRILAESEHDALCAVSEPIEHTLALASAVVVAGSFLRYILDDAPLARRYLRIGLGAAAFGYLATFLWWPRQLAADPEIRFHQTWSAWFLHLVSSGLILTAIYILVRKEGWLRNVVLVALTFLFMGEFIVLVNLFTKQAHNRVLCPIGNSFHIWAIPLFGLVYYREQSIEKRRAEEELKAYRDDLEELVTARTAELTSTNAQLQREIGERVQAEAEIARRNAELAAQNAIAATISQSLELDAILNAALDRALAVLRMEAGCIFLLDPDDESLALQVYQGQTSPGEAVEYALQECLCREVSERAVTDLKSVVLDTADHPTGSPCPFNVEGGNQILVGTPLVSKGRAVGALVLSTQQMEAIPPQQMELLTAIGQQIGMAVENARLFLETEHWAEAMALLHELSVFLSSTLDPVEIYDQITQQSAKLLDCPAANLFQWDEEHQEAVGVSAYGANGQAVEGLRLPLDENPLLAHLVAERRPISLEDAQEDPRVPASWRGSTDIRALLGLPIWGTGKPLGFLFLIDPHKARRWRADEISLLESFIDRAAVALERAHLHKQLEWAAALEERQRIAADMHDGLAQTLGYVGLRTDRATELLEEGQVQQVLDEFQRLRDAIGQASRDVRRSIATLQESPRPRQSLQEALGQIVHEFAAGAEPAVELLDSLQEPLFLPPGSLEQVLRVVQEALLNARRHARARHISVRLEGRGEAVGVSVEDDGQGFDPDKAASRGGDHFGLSIMRARAARIGGEITIDSLPGQGARVVLTWPLDSRNGNVERNL